MMCVRAISGQELAELIPSARGEVEQYMAPSALAYRTRMNRSWSAIDKRNHLHYNCSNLPSVGVHIIVQIIHPRHIVGKFLF
jgi:hypothetical protein